MNNVAVYRPSLLTVLMRIGRVGIGIFALSLVLGALPAIPTAFAAAHVPPHRVQIDGSVQSFHMIDDQRALVQGENNQLWLERAPFGSVPPGRVQIDANVKDFEGLSSTQVAVRGTDDKLWLVSAPFS